MLPMQALQSKEPARPPSRKDEPPLRSRPPRVPHACDRCRLMRTKCSGGERCTKCVKDDTPCEYGDGKREKNKRDLVEGRERIDSLAQDKFVLLKQNAELVTLLRNISSMEGFPAGTFPEVTAVLAEASSMDVASGDDADRRKRPVRQSVGSGSATTASIIEGLHVNTSSLPETSNSHQVGEAFEIAGDVGSPGRQGELLKGVDLEYGGGAAGFIGKASPISWVQRCKEHLAPISSLSRLRDPIETTQTQLDSHDAAANKVNYYLDDADLLSIDEDIIVSEDIPPPDVAYLLAEACFHSLQGAFLFNYRAEFIETLRHFPPNRPTLSWTQRQWLATANLVFAIGARWLQYTHMDDLITRYNHVEFYARARALGLDHRVVFDHPVLEQVQSLGLLGFYLYVNGSISRAWTINGHALRHATALGLHLRVTDASISLIDRLRRARTWYSLYNMEILISETTGRPKAITPDDITVLIEDAAMQYPVLDPSRPAPQMRTAAGESWVDWQAFLLARRRPTVGVEDNRQTFQEPAPQILESISLNQFSQRIRLCMISHRVGSALYSAAAGLQSWSDFQTKLASLDAAMLTWRKDLPESIKISPDEIKSNGSDPRPQIELALYYHSVRMILHRPCVCKIDIMNESARSKEFNVKSARACIRGAVSILELMPEVDYNHAQDVFQLVPWWAALHYVAQAASILMLEMAINCEHLARDEFQQDQQQLISSLRKAMDYLWLLAATSRSAAKAWTIFRQLFDETMLLYREV